MNKSGYIYVGITHNKRIKIGYSINPEHRLLDHPKFINWVYIYRSVVLKDEQRLHTYFWPNYVKRTREWYTPRSRGYKWGNAILRMNSDMERIESLEAELKKAHSLPPRKTKLSTIVLNFTEDTNELLRQIIEKTRLKKRIVISDAIELLAARLGVK